MLSTCFTINITELLNYSTCEHGRHFTDNTGPYSGTAPNPATYMQILNPINNNSVDLPMISKLSTWEIFAGLWQRYNNTAWCLGSCDAWGQTATSGCYCVANTIVQQWWQQCLSKNSLPKSAPRADALLTLPELWYQIVVLDLNKYKLLHTLTRKEKSKEGHEITEWWIHSHMHMT